MLMRSSDHHIFIKLCKRLFINIVVFEIKVLTKYIDRVRISHAQKFEIKKQFDKIFNKFHLVVFSFNKH